VGDHANTASEIDQDSYKLDEFGTHSLLLRVVILILVQICDDKQQI
jgi:hypothetical protein